MPRRPEALEPDGGARCWRSHQPRHRVLSGAQRERLGRIRSACNTHVVNPAIVPAYLEDDAMPPADPAACDSRRSHPLADLDWDHQTVDAPGPAGVPKRRAPCLFRHARTRPQLTPIFRRVKRGSDLALAAAEHGVASCAHPSPIRRWRRPIAPRGRTFIRGNLANFTASTLADSQAAGLPGMARRRTRLADAHRRRADRQRRRCRGRFRRCNARPADRPRRVRPDERGNARLLRRGRTWPVAAAEFEEVLA